MKKCYKAIDLVDTTFKNWFKTFITSACWKTTALNQGLLHNIQIGNLKSWSFNVIFGSTCHFESPHRPVSGNPSPVDVENIPVFMGCFIDNINSMTCQMPCLYIYIWNASSHIRSTPLPPWHIIPPFSAVWSSYVVDESMMDAKWKNVTMSLVIRSL